MSTAKKVPSKKRLNVNVSEPLFETINELAVCEGGDKGDVLKKAISLLEIVVKAKKKGGRLIIVDETSGKTKEIEILGI